MEKTTVVRITTAALFLACSSSLAAQTTFTVNSANDADDGTCDATHCSLREAVNAANADAGADIIAFNIAGAGPHTIQPVPWIPGLTDAVTIDGTTQPGYSGTPLIELDGSNAAVDARGLIVFSANCTIRGLAINRFPTNGIELTADATGTVIEGNYIGTDVTGTIDLGNGNAGVMIDAADNTIGGTTAQARNVISGNLEGVTIADPGATGNAVIGNYIGTNAAGDAAVGNTVGVLILAPGNTVGGSAAEARNVISGNEFGVFIDDAGASDNEIIDNYIGPDANGDNLGNTTDGVTITAGTGNRITSNSIYGSGGLGIDLGGDGVTPNDEGDADNGPNGLQNYPILTPVSNGSGSIVKARLNSSANSYWIEFFSSPTCNASGYGEGMTLLGMTTLITDLSGNGSTTVTSLGDISGSWLTAIARADGNTSEFSLCAQATDFSVSITPATSTVTAGQSATYTVTVTTESGIFNDEVSLACSGAPNLATCSFSEEEVVPGSSQATSTLTVATTAPSGSVAVASTGPVRLAWVGLLALALMAAASLSGQRNRSRSSVRVPRILSFVAFASVLLLIQAACSEDTTEPTPGTPAGTYDITVTGTWESVDHSGTTTLVVN